MIRIGQAGPEWLRRLLGVEEKVEIPRGPSIDAVSNSSSFTTTTSWFHVFGHEVNALSRWPATVRGVVVLVIQNGSASDQVTTVKFGSVEMEEIPNSPAIRSGTAPGMVHAFFLARTAIPQLPEEKVEITASGTDAKIGVCYTLYSDNPLTVQVNTKSQQAEGTFAPTAGPTISTGQRGISFNGILANLPNVSELGLGEAEGRAAKDFTFDFGSQVGGVAHKYVEFNKAESQGYHPWSIPLAFFTVLEFVVREIKDYGQIVPALPETMGKGDKCHLLVDATNNIIWDLEYDGRNATYPWRKTGGAPVRLEAEGSVTTTSTSYVDLSGGPSLVTPVAGEYQITMSTLQFNSTVANGETYSAANIEGTVNEKTYLRVNNNSPTTVSKKSSPIRIASGATVKMQHKASSGTCFVQYRIIELDPVRVG